MMLLALGCLHLTSLSTFASPDLAVGDRAPDFKVRPLASKTTAVLTLEDFKGKTLLLEFWATWCESCRPASEHLASLHDRLGKTDLVILSLSKEQPEKVRLYLERHPVRYLAGVDESGATQRAYGVRSIPRAFLINSAGRLVWFGNPLELSVEALQTFLRTGAAPPIRPATTQEATTRRAGESILTVECSRVVGQPATRPVLCGSRRDMMSTYQAEAEPLEEIVAFMLAVSPQRVERDPSLPEELYDLNMAYRPQDRRRADPQLPIDVLCRACGVILEEVVEEREAWVVRAGPVHPPKGSGPSFIGPDSSGTWKYKCVPINRLLKNIESGYKVFTVDETGLAGEYDLTLPAGVDLGQARDHLAKKCGLTMSLERRKVRLWKLRPTVPASSKPTSQETEDD